MHAPLDAGFEVEHPEHAAARHHGELAFALAAVNIERIVGGRVIRRPYIEHGAARAAFAPVLRDLVDLDGGVALFVVAGDDAAEGGKVISFFLSEIRVWMARRWKVCCVCSIHQTQADAARNALRCLHAGS